MTGCFHCLPKSLLLLLITFLNGAICSLSAEMKPDDLIVFKTVPGDVSALNLHMFYPENYDVNGSFPAIVFFFGGGWNGGSADQFYPQAKYLASRGMVAISAEYRTKKSHGVLPFACVEDGKSAIRFVRQNAKRFGIDSDRIAAGGGSAGGHVAAATGTLERFDTDPSLEISSVPDALVLFNPVYDNGPDGYGYERVKDYWTFFSPMHNLKAGQPPAIVFLGDKDNLIPVSTAQAYQTSMHQLGIQSELFIFEGQSHGFFNWSRDETPGKEIFTRIMSSADAFLTSLGFLEGDSTIVEWVAAELAEQS